MFAAGSFRYVANSRDALAGRKGKFSAFALASQQGACLLSLLWAGGVEP